MATPARLTCAFLFVFAGSGCSLDLCLDPADLGVGATGQPIIGGQLDETHHATVALLLTQPDGSGGLCSGTVIATDGEKGFVLTAAHCATGTVDHIFEATDWRDCTQAGDASGCNASYEPKAVYVHPAYDPATHANDFAVVVFGGANADTVVVPPGGVSDGLVQGGVVELSGFGRTYAGAAQQGVFNYERHVVSVPIASLAPSWLRFDASTGKSACFGDSGGPAYSNASGSLRVVGVTSNGDGTCEHVANYGRVSAVYADFIEPIIHAAVSSGQGGASSEGGAGAGGQGAGAGGQGAGAGGQGTGGQGAGGQGAGAVGGQGAGAGSPSEGGGETGGSPAHGSCDGGAPPQGSGANGAGEGEAGGDDAAGGGDGAADLSCIPLTLSCSASPRELPRGAGALVTALAVLATALARRSSRAPARR